MLPDFSSSDEQNPHIPFEYIEDESGLIDLTINHEDGRVSSAEGYFILYRLPSSGEVLAGFVNYNFELIAFGRAFPLPAATTADQIQHIMNELEKLRAIHVDEKGEATEFTAVALTEM